MPFEAPGTALVDFYDLDGSNLACLRRDVKCHLNFVALCLSEGF